MNKKALPRSFIALEIVTFLFCVGLSFFKGYYSLVLIPALIGFLPVAAIIFYKALKTDEGWYAQKVRFHAYATICLLFLACVAAPAEADVEPVYAFTIIPVGLGSGLIILSGLVWFIASILAIIYLGLLARSVRLNNASLQKLAAHVTNK